MGPPTTGYDSRMMLFLAAWMTTADARPPSGSTQVVVVMKSAGCAVCARQMRQLSQAELGVSLMGITHGSSADAARVTNATGVRTYSHAAGIEAMGLFREDLGMAMPAVVVYDRCGDEVGRLVGRAPGIDATTEVRTLVVRAESVDTCAKKPQS